MIRKLKNAYHFGQALTANFWYGNPAKKLTVIGVTGTDGKTTTASLIYAILKEAGKKVSLITSVNAKIGNLTIDTGFHVTTPDPFFLQKMLQKAVISGSKYLILEVTSHAIDQNRIVFIPFSIGVLTNISREHLDYHKTFESYIKTKVRFLLSCNKILINTDDLTYRNVSDLLKLKMSQNKIIRYGQKSSDYSFKNNPFSTDLPGEYNKSNCLAAYACARILNIEVKVIQNAIREFKGVTGRFEIIDLPEKPTVIIDFAHTPNALENVLFAVKKMNKGKIIHVFGCAGKRYADKRSVMGEISAKFSDITVITEEDYRTEKLTVINQAIISGIEKYNKTSGKKHPHFIKVDRKEAVRFAIELAKPDDTVILTGKGHEKSLCRGKTEYPWNERDVVMTALNNEQFKTDK